MCSDKSGHRIALAFLLGIVALVSSCRTEDSPKQPATSIPAPKPIQSFSVGQAPTPFETSPPTVFTDGTVSFENVTFTFDRDWIDHVEASVLPAEKLESDDIKPDNIRGRTLKFDLKYRNSDDISWISVFKVADYKESFALFPRYIEHRDRDLAAVIKKSSPGKTWGIDDPVHLTWMDASHDFYAKSHIVRFNGGRGLLMLTQISQDRYVFDNELLEYFFQGFSDDGVYFVEMDFFADMRGLGEESARRYGLPDDFNNTRDFALYNSYRRKMAKEIDSAPNARFTPSPDKIEAFLKSFKIDSAKL